MQTLIEGIVSTGKKSTSVPASSKQDRMNEQVTLLESTLEDVNEDDVQLTPQMELYYKTINRTLNS